MKIALICTMPTDIKTDPELFELFNPLQILLAGRKEDLKPDLKIGIDYKITIEEIKLTPTNKNNPRYDADINTPSASTSNANTPWPIEEIEKLIKPT